MSLLLVCVPLLLSGCIKVGPDFVRPDAPIATNWLDSQDNRLSNGPVDYRAWWRLFNDPVLDRLIDTAYRQNLSLRIAGVRVLEARAQLGIAIGGLYPQTQQIYGSLQRHRVSERSPLAASASSPTATDPDDPKSRPTSGGSGANLKYWQSEVGLSAGWELDFWGKFRRAIESSDASLSAVLADYDSALVSLTADVANSYAVIRTLEKRIEIARQNAQTQLESLKIAEARLEAGTTSQRDSEQAKTLLNDTQASIPALESQLRQTGNALSVLLGMPPGHPADLLAGTSDIPVPPSRIAIGIPADLLRRRPDVRSAEYQAAAQCAQIGIAKADLLPAFSLTGTFSFLSSDVGTFALNDMFQWRSRNYVAGPNLQWNIFNYGRLTNNVRVQDARFQQLFIGYQNAVLKAQQEVEDALVSYLKAQERAEFLAESARAAKRSLDLATLQYREGVADFTAVLTAQQALLAAQDNLTSTLGDIAGSLITAYRALGGGWEIRKGMDLIPAEVSETMAKRTDWGNLLKPSVYMPADSDIHQSLIRPPDW